MQLVVDSNGLSVPALSLQCRRGGSRGALEAPTVRQLVAPGQFIHVTDPVSIGILQAAEEARQTPTTVQNTARLPFLPAPRTQANEPYSNCATCASPTLGIVEMAVFPRGCVAKCEPALLPHSLLRHGTRDGTSPSPTPSRRCRLVGAGLVPARCSRIPLRPGSAGRDKPVPYWTACGRTRGPVCRVARSNQSSAGVSL